jgi:hypothetical protein
MKFSNAPRQQGASVLGLMALAALVAVLIVLGARVTPTVLEFRAIEAAVEKAKRGETPDQVRTIFDRAAEVEGIRSISGKDLDISRDDNGKVSIKYAYDRQFSLGGPAYLLIKYAGRST